MNIQSYIIAFFRKFGLPDAYMTAVEPGKQQGAAEALAAAPLAATVGARDVTAELQKLADLHKSCV